MATSSKSILLYFRNSIMAFKCLTSHVPEYLSSQFIIKARRKKQAHHKKFRDAEHSTFQDC